MNTPRSRLSALSPSLLLVPAVLMACSGSPSRHADSPRPAATPATPHRIVLDGRFDDWPPDTAAIADDQYVYFKFDIPEEATIQANSETLAIWIDADANPATGFRPSAPAAAKDLGIELTAQFSPQRDASGTLPGTAVYAYSPSGAAAPTSHARVDLSVAPTHAARTFEGRISRRVAGDPAIADAGFADAGLYTAGPASIMFALIRPDGRVVGWSEPEAFEKPPAAAAPALSNFPIPPPAPGCVRIVSYNVEKSAPMKDPERFARLFQALAPDIVLVQEWSDVDDRTLEQWFTALIPSSTPWNARVSSGPGVAVIARHPIEPLGPARLSLEETGSSTDESIRWVAAVVKTPQGDIDVATLHLKCCGAMDSREDQKRTAQARVINAAMRGALSASGGRARLIAGDFNLVGSRPPLDVLRAGLDSDGSDLAVAEPFVLGDAVQTTWFSGGESFSAGRLDYAVFGDAGATVDRTFVLDTRRMSDAALAVAGLDRGDSGASDHLPVVIDLRPR